MKQNSPFVITISRQLGSGGARVGQQLAKHLNIFYADREIISEASKQLKILEEELESHDEKISSFWQSFLKLYAYGTPDAFVPPKLLGPTDRELFEIQSAIIKRIAQGRSAVIIGRCGSYILRKHPNHVSIFLHGDIAFRKDNVQKMFNVSGKEAEKMITQNDKERALYYQTFTGREWTDVRQYDLAIDTSKIGIDKSVDLILKYLEYSK